MEKYKNFLRDDIEVKIVSNFGFEKVENFEEFKERIKDADFGAWIEKNKMGNGELKIDEIKIFNNEGEELTYEDVVLNYMRFLNTFLREQLGVCIDKSVPRVIDNELTYLIVQRKDYKDFDNNFFIANKGEIIFPMISKEFDLELALIKLAEWKQRAGKNLIKFQ